MDVLPQKLYLHDSKGDGAFTFGNWGEKRSALISLEIPAEVEYHQD
jgi:hypothetical protein